MWVCPTIGVIVQQNRKSPSTVLTAHNSTGNRTFMCNNSIYLWFICFPWWSIDELENLNADRTTVCFEPWWKLRARLGFRKTGLSPPVFLYWPFQGGTSVVIPYCYLFLLSVFILWFSYYDSAIFCKFYVAEWPPIWERAVHSVFRECLS